MTTAILNGQTTWKMTRDKDAHRTYKITFRVRGAITDGPANVLQTPGLPVYGSFWSFDADVDVWAYCQWDAEVSPVVEGEANTEWTVEFTFSTKNDRKCCKENQVEDPLLEPMEIGGGSSRYTETATIDRFGKPVLNSALEQIEGPENQWDANRSTVKIKQNVPVLQRELCESMVDCVNDAPLWGSTRRKVKLTSFTFEQKFYGTCNVYYVRSFEFEINNSSWDRLLLDQGTKALHGHHDATTGDWVLDNINGLPPDPKNPLHFKRYKDRAGENTTVILDGHGQPYIPPELDDGAEEQWWALGMPRVAQAVVGVEDLIALAKGNSTAGLALQATCADAVDYAVQYSFRIAGPYDTKSRAEDVLHDEDFLEAFSQAPVDVISPLTGEVTETGIDCGEVDGSSRIGRIPVQKYPGANFLLLGIPTEI